MGRIDGYSAYNADFNRNIYNNRRTGQAENAKAESKTVENKGSVDKTETKQSELSQKAKDLLKRIEQAREEKRAKKKEEEKAKKTEKLDEQREERIKKGIVKADSVEELMKNIKSFDWDNATEEIRSRTGRYFDVAT